jgi:hypothetical protein
MTGYLPRALRDCRYEIPRVLRVSTAHELGMTASAIRHAVAARGWQRLAHGFLLTAPGPPVRADWASLGLELAGATGALSGWDALDIVGLAEPVPPGPEVLVLSRRGRHRRVGDALIRPTDRPYRTWLLPADHPELPFAPIVHTARAVADAGLQYRRLSPVRALVTRAVQTGRCTVEELVAEVDDCPRNFGGPLRRAVADLRDGALSVAEAEAIGFLRRSAVPAFEANVPIVTASGVLLAVADVLWRELRAIAEIDSRQFHFDEEGWTRTRRRHNLLTRYGVAVQHYAPVEVRAGKLAWGREVESWLRARARELGVRYVVPRVRPPLGHHPRPFVVPDLPA